MRQALYRVTDPAAYTRRTTGWSGTEKLLAIEGPSRTVRGATPVVWCHGLLGDAWSARQGPWYVELRKLAAYGYPVYSADLGGGAVTASNAAIALVSSLITYLGTTYGTRTDRVVIAGESMGSLLAMNWAWRNQHRVAALWVRAPLVDAAAVHDRVPAIGAAMEASWAADGGYAAGLVLHDPMVAANLAALAPLAGRMRLDYTSDDEVTTAEDVGRFLGVMPPLDEVHAWPGTHIHNAAVDGNGVAEWIGRTVEDRITRPGGPLYG